MLRAEPVKLPSPRPLVGSVSRRVYRRAALPDGWVRCGGCGHLVELPMNTAGPLLCSECQWELAR